MTEAQLRALPEHATSAEFSEVEKLVLDFAVGMTRTPVDVPDELFARLREHFDEGQLVELANEIAIENYRARFNWAFGIGSQGFTGEGFCVRPGGASDRLSRFVRPTARLPWRSVPPLITPEEARQLGEIEDHAEIEALVERAWKARVERFGDSTDMCSLVNAKSGGCAEDCGFCAQSRFAEADTPMHAMMTPEQILEHAARRRGRGRPPLLHGHPGTGPLQEGLRVDPRGRAAGGERDQPQALRLGRATCRSSARSSSRTRASSACTTTWRPPRATTTRSPPPSATRAGCARSTP